MEKAKPAVLLLLICLLLLADYIDIMHNKFKHLEEYSLWPGSHDSVKNIDLLPEILLLALPKDYFILAIYFVAVANNDYYIYNIEKYYCLPKRNPSLHKAT